MNRKFDGLLKEKFDIIVIGGGVIGTGVARDASLRGLKTLLVEKEDFGYGTTSRSTRLIHGGLRYLSHLDFKLVRQDLREREILLKIAPHLVKPLPFLLPVTSISQHLIMGVGMRLYDNLSNDKSVPAYKYFSQHETMEMESQLELKYLKGSYKFYDCQVSFPERLCIENAVSATENGAVILNHAEIIGFLKTGRTIHGVRIKDKLSSSASEVESRLVVNVTGHWTNGILGLAAADPGNEIKTTKGVHLVTRRISQNALVIFSQSDGRLLFVIPWQGYSLIGTTDTVYSGDKETIQTEMGDVTYLVNEVKHSFPDFTSDDIFYTIAGLRSLVSAKNQKVSNISRSHKLVDHETTEGLQGLVSILGGKMTGYRSIAQETVDLICRKFGLATACVTGERALPGAPGFSSEELDNLANENPAISRATLEHLNSLYGSRLVSILELVRSDPRGNQKLCQHSPDILAQLWYAIKEESCVTVADFMLRRGTVGLASCQGLDAVEVVGVEMGRLLGWSIGEWQRQTEAYRLIVAPGTFFKKG
jgi:glycerol-3-phosphate dehydrogenase